MIQPPLASPSLPEGFFGSWDISGRQNTPWDKNLTLRTIHFYRVWPWETYWRWYGFEPLVFSGCQNTIRQRLEKLTFLRHGLEKTVTFDTALDLPISQGLKTCFEPKPWEISYLEFTCRSWANIEWPWEKRRKLGDTVRKPKRFPTLRKNKNSLSIESGLKKDPTLRKCWATLRFFLTILKFLRV